MARRKGDIKDARSVYQAMRLVDEGKSIRAAAEQCGLGVSSLARHVKKPETRAAYETWLKTRLVDEDREMADRAVMLITAERYSVAQVAHELDVSKGTIYRWLKDPRQRLKLLSAAELATAISAMRIDDVADGLIAIGQDDYNEARDRIAAFGAAAGVLLKRMAIVGQKPPVTNVTNNTINAPASGETAALEQVKTMLAQVAERGASKRAAAIQAEVVAAQ